MNVLYSFRRCPYAIRVRMALYCAGIVCEVVEVSLKQKPAALIALSAKATVPVLQTEKGDVLDESLSIMRWALLQNDPHNWLQFADQPANIALLQTNDADFKQWLDRYKYFERYPDQSQDDYRQEAVRCMLEPLEQRLEQDVYLGGNAPCLTDVAIFPFIRQFAGVDPVWFGASPFQATRQWLERWLTSEVFTAVIARR